MDIGFSNRSSAAGRVTIAVKAAAGYPSYSRTASGSGTDAAFVEAKKMILDGFKGGDGKPFTATVRIEIGGRKCIGLASEETVEKAIDAARADVRPVEGTSHSRDKHAEQPSAQA